MSQPLNWSAIAALIRRDLTAIRRSKAVTIPLLVVPFILLVIMPAVLTFAARGADASNANELLTNVPDELAGPVTSLPPDERLIILVDGFLLAPLFLIVPLMVSAVLAADAFAGEKERRTMESLLHLPISERDIYVGKFLEGFLPAVAVSWLGYLVFGAVTSAIAWPVLGRPTIASAQWAVLIGWVAPASAALGIGIMTRISARVNTTQEANQLGGAVVLPLMFVAIAQTSVLLAVPATVGLVVGAVIWVVAIGLAARGARRYTRDRLAARI